MELTIDGTKVTAEPGESVLQCALRCDISIPHLCNHPDLKPVGACRICLVEIDGVRGFPSSCTTPARDGMVVRTETPALADLRRRILEFILLEHPSACLLCDKKELCERYRPKASKAGRTTGCHTCNNKEVCDVKVLSEVLGVTDLPVPGVYRNFRLERQDPFIDRDLNLCILCGRCVGICKAHQGWGILEFVGRGSDTRIGQAFGRSLTDAGCRFCGSCVDVCPTGTLSDRFAKWYGAAAKVTTTTCGLCDAACALNVSATATGRPVGATGADSSTALCVLGRFCMAPFLNGVTRLCRPKLRFGKVLRAVPWPEAVAAAAERLAPFRGDAFALVCDGSSTLEDRHLFERFTREVMKSPHYVELPANGRAQARVALPAGVRAALLTGDFVSSDCLEALEVLVVTDCYPTPASKLATLELPATVLAEVEGTLRDGGGELRPLKIACDPPGQARADWRIVCDLATALGGEGFAFASLDAVTKSIGAQGASLILDRAAPPPAATDPTRRWTHFRGHRLEDVARGLGGLPAAAMAEAEPIAASPGPGPPAQDAAGYRNELVPSHPALAEG